jgi:hypothetical protein
MSEPKDSKYRISEHQIQQIISDAYNALELLCNAVYDANQNNLLETIPQKEILQPTE